MSLLGAIEVFVLSTIVVLFIRELRRSKSIDRLRRSNIVPLSEWRKRRKS